MVSTRDRMVFPGWMLIAGFFVMASSIYMSGEATPGTDVGKEVSPNLESKLKAIRKPALKTMLSSDGDLIDCVDIYKQPAFDHPGLKNHTIQVKPSYIQDQSTIEKNNSSRWIPLQIWQGSGNCPKGSIPIRRVRKQDLLRWDNLEGFGRKNPQMSNISEERQNYANRTLVINDTFVNLGPQPNRSSALLVGTVFHFQGSRAALNVWNPGVASADDYSSSQIWLQGGGPSDYASVECGWIVNPKLYGDAQTRLFIYWTNDGSQTTGCFDLLCSGFVQTSSEIAVGVALSPVSSPGGTQYEISVQITRDDNSGNWWVQIQGKDVGYWPGSLFSVYLRSGATLAQWGGEVYSPNVKKSPHTTTAMGSGEFAEGHFGYASYIGHIRVLYSSDTWTYPPYVGTYVDEKDCYSAFHYVPGFMAEPTVFFGGPGRCPRCP